MWRNKCEWKKYFCSNWSSLNPPLSKTFKVSNSTPFSHPSLKHSSQFRENFLKTRGTIMRAEILWLPHKWIWHVNYKRLLRFVSKITFLGERHSFFQICWDGVLQYLRFKIQKYIFKVLFFAIVDINVFCHGIFR